MRAFTTFRFSITCGIRRFPVGVSVTSEIRRSCQRNPARRHASALTPTVGLDGSLQRSIRSAPHFRSPFLASNGLRQMLLNWEQLRFGCIFALCTNYVRLINSEK
jgi:hypothetical protein